MEIGILTTFVFVVAIIGVGGGHSGGGNGGGRGGGGGGESDQSNDDDNQNDYFYSPHPSPFPSFPPTPSPTLFEDNVSNDHSCWWCGRGQRSNYSQRSSSTSIGGRSNSFNLVVVIAMAGGAAAMLSIFIRKVSICVELLIDYIISILSLCPFFL